MYYVVRTSSDGKLFLVLYKTKEARVANNLKGVLQKRWPKVGFKVTTMPSQVKSPTLTHSESTTLSGKGLTHRWEAWYSEGTEHERTEVGS